MIGFQQIYNFLTANLFLRNSKYYHDNCYNTDNRVVLFFKNLINPSRMLTKILYSQVIPLPQSLRKSSYYQPTDLGGGDYNYFSNELRKNGYILLPAYFREEAKRIVERYAVYAENFEPSSHYYRKWIDPNDADIFQMMSNQFTLSILASFYRCQPFIRNFMAINQTYPILSMHDALDKVDFNYQWHFDTANQLTAHIFLTDVVNTESRMLLAKKSHLRHHHTLSRKDRFYSEEYIRDHYDIIDCCGPAGTFFIFDSNSIHRLEMVKESFRSHLHLNFTPGNDMPTNFKNDEEWGVFDAIPSLEGLNHLQKDAFRYIERLLKKVDPKINQYA